MPVSIGLPVGNVVLSCHALMRFQYFDLELLNKFCLNNFGVIIHLEFIFMHPC